MIIAIDGPSASGKGTLARRLASHLGFAYLDTGSLYRAVALEVLAADADPRDARASALAARNLDFKTLDDPRLREEKIGEAASLVAAIPEVRSALLAFQRSFAKTPPGGLKGAIIDGRDIGTVVCPDADLKIFVTAGPAVRAKRRILELEGRGLPADPETILSSVRLRDARDEARKISPLRPAEDAHLLDTTNLDIDSAFKKACVILKVTGLFEKM